MVAFESLALDGEVVATHEDVDDKGQSVDLRVHVPISLLRPMLCLVASATPSIISLVTQQNRRSAIERIPGSIRFHGLRR